MKTREQKTRFVIVAVLLTLSCVYTVGTLFDPSVAHAQVGEFYQTQQECNAACLPSPPNYCAVDANGALWICNAPGGDATIERNASAGLEGALARWTFKLTVLPLIGGITYVLLAFSALLVGLSGVALSKSVEFFILKMGALIEEVDSIELAWTLLRDIANVLFIFIILYIAIAMIVRISNVNAGKLLTKVIVAALLINFSLFFSRVIIDASNVLAHEFYKPIESFGTVESDVDGTEIQVLGFGAAFMNALGLQTIYDGGVIGALGEFTEVRTIMIHIGGAILGLVAAFTFFAVAILLVIRFVMFVILMVTSPVAFAGGLLPGVNNFADQWWKTMINQAFFAPVFMLFASIAFVIVSDESFRNFLSNNNPDNLSFANAFSGEGDSIAIFLNFFIVIGFLITALVASKTMAKEGAGKAVDWSTRMAGKATFGATSFLARETVGRAGRAVAESPWANKLAKRSGLTGLVGKGLVQSADKLQKGSLDARGIVGGFGVDTGRAPSGGFKQTREEREKRYQGYFEKAGGPHSGTAQEVERRRRRLAESARNIGFEKAQEAMRREQKQEEAEKERREAESSANAAQEEQNKAAGALGEAKTSREREEAEKRKTKADERLAQATVKLEQARAKSANAETNYTNLAENQKEYLQSRKDLSEAEKRLKDEIEAQQKFYAEQAADASNAFGRRSGADKVRKGKSKKDRALEAYEEWAKEEKAPAEAIPAPSAPPPTGGGRTTT